jgi:hypothetical protein
VILLKGMLVTTLLVILGITIQTHVFADRIECQGDECIGTDGNDNMIGSDSVDEMDSLAGNDRMVGDHRPTGRIFVCAVTIL